MEKDIAFEWADKFLELLDLLNEVTSTLEQPAATSELHYQVLRSWLIDHQNTIVRLWKEFSESPEFSVREDDQEEYVVNPETIEIKYMGKPARDAPALEPWALLVELWDSLCIYEERPRLSDSADEDAADPPVLPEYLENPFLVVYEPDNLYGVAFQLGLQSGVDKWEPSEYWATQVRSFWVGLATAVRRLADWVEERAFNMESWLTELY